MSTLKGASQSLPGQWATAALLGAPTPSHERFISLSCPGELMGGLTRCHSPQTPRFTARRVLETRKTGPKPPREPQPSADSPCLRPVRGGTGSASGTRGHRDPGGSGSGTEGAAGGHREGQWEGTGTRAGPGGSGGRRGPSARPDRGSASRRPLSAHSDPARAASSPHPSPGRYWPFPPPVSGSPLLIGRSPPVGGRARRFLIRQSGAALRDL